MQPQSYNLKLDQVLGYTKSLVAEFPHATNMKTQTEPIYSKQLDDLRMIVRNLEIIKQITEYEATEHDTIERTK